MSLNLAYMQLADAFLTSAGLQSYLQFWTHAAFGVKRSGSVMQKAYCLGTTRLPRGGDLTFVGTDTLYDATGINGGPCWVNTTGNAYGYWGGAGVHYNQIRRKREITIAVLYERTTTAADCTFVGTGPVFGTNFDGSAILALRHTAGTPGTIQFILSDAGGAKMATVTANGFGPQVAIGTYDGTNMVAYSNTTAGSANSALNPNPDFGDFNGIVESALAGARQNQNTGSACDGINVAGFGFKEIHPFLGSGARHAYVLRANTEERNYDEAEAQFKMQSVMILETGVGSTTATAISNFMQSESGAAPATTALSAVRGVYSLSGVAALLAKSGGAPVVHFRRSKH